jgi:hypothetical protein
MKRDRHGRFLKRHRRSARRHNPARASRRRNTAAMASNPRRRRRSGYVVRHSVVRRRNPVFPFPDLAMVGGVALGAVVMRAAAPQITRLVPVGAIQGGWGNVAWNLALGYGLGWATGKVAGRKWGDAVTMGAVALVAVQAADLMLAPAGKPLGEEGDPGLNFYGGNPQLGADGEGNFADTSAGVGFYAPDRMGVS